MQPQRKKIPFTAYAKMRYEMVMIIYVHVIQNIRGIIFVLYKVGSNQNGCNLNTALSDQERSLVLTDLTSLYVYMVTHTH